MFSNSDCVKTKRRGTRETRAEWTIPREMKTRDSKCTDEQSGALYAAAWK